MSGILRAGLFYARSPLRAVDALKRLNKPIPEGSGQPCQPQQPVNPLEQ